MESVMKLPLKVSLKHQEKCHQDVIAHRRKLRFSFDFRLGFFHHLKERRSDISYRFVSRRNAAFSAAAAAISAATADAAATFAATASITAVVVAAAVFGKKGEGEIKKTGCRLKTQRGW